MHINKVYEIYDYKVRFSSAEKIRHHFKRTHIRDLKNSKYKTCIKTLQKKRTQHQGISINLQNHTIF